MSISSTARLFLLAALFAPLAVDSVQAQASENIVFDFRSVDKKLEGVNATRRTIEQDRERMNGKRASKPTTLSEDTLANEKSLYSATGFTLAPSGMRVNSFAIGSNVPTARQNCAGLTFARLIGEPAVLSTAEGARIVETFGTRIAEKDARPGDIVYWRDPTGQRVQHFALVEGYKSVSSRAGIVRELTIISKDDKERVYVGPAHMFPAEWKNGGVERTFVRIDWDSIKVTLRPKNAPDSGVDRAKLLSSIEGKCKMYAKFGLKTISFSVNGNQLDGKFEHLNGSISVQLDSVKPEGSGTWSGTGDDGKAFSGDVFVKIRDGKAEMDLWLGKREANKPKWTTWWAEKIKN